MLSNGKTTHNMQLNESKFALISFGKVTALKVPYNLLTSENVVASNTVRIPE